MMPNDPLVILHVALMDEISDSIRTSQLKEISFDLDQQTFDFIQFYIEWLRIKMYRMISFKKIHHLSILQFSIQFHQLNLVRSRFVRVFSQFRSFRASRYRTRKRVDQTCRPSIES